MLGLLETALGWEAISLRTSSTEMTNPLAKEAWERVLVIPPVPENMKAASGDKKEHDAEISRGKLIDKPGGQNVEESHLHQLPFDGRRGIPGEQGLARPFVLGRTDTHASAPGTQS
jgi:hypothetical protein